MEPTAEQELSGASSLKGVLPPRGRGEPWARGPGGLTTQAHRNLRESVGSLGKLQFQHTVQRRVELHSHHALTSERESGAALSVLNMHKTRENDKTNLTYSFQEVSLKDGEYFFFNTIAIPLSSLDDRQ